VFTLYEKEPEQVDAIVNSLAKRLEEPWEYKDFTIQINASIMVGTFPNQIRSVSEMLYMIENPIPSTK
jgi:hypothetical protein